MSTSKSFFTVLVIHFALFIIYVYGTSYDIPNTPGANPRRYAGRFKFLTFWNLCYARIWELCYVADEEGNQLFYYRGFPGKIKYLTFWCQVIQTIYFGFCVINDLFGSNNGPFTVSQRSKLQKFRDYFLAAVVYPLGGFVVLSFWGIYAIDRELVFPKILDDIIPTWLNHIMHTTVIFFLLIDKFFIYHHYPSRKAGLTGTVIFASLYQVWIFWIAYYAEIWVYPILAVLSWPMRAVFILACWSLMVIIYLSGEVFTKHVWKPTKSSLIEDKKID